MIRAGSLAVVCAALAAWCPIAASQTERPVSSRRIVQQWDFEDPISRIEPVPLGWFRAQDAPPIRERPDFPAWNIPIITTEAARSGERSILLPTRGGNTSLTLAGGAIAALPDADYLIRAAVRTDGLVHARACLTAWFLDAKLERLQATPTRSPLVITDGQWRIIETEMRGLENAAWIQIELQVLQPESFEPAHTTQHVWNQDFAGRAYFDDVLVAQVPRIDLRSAAPTSIIVEPAIPELWAYVRDLTGEELQIDVSVYDLEGTLVDQTRRTAPEGGRRVTWTPSLPAFGWYRAVMQVESENGAVGSRILDLVWAPASDVPDAAARQHFGIIAEDLSAEQRTLLPEFLRATLSGSVNLATWPPGISSDLTDHAHADLVRDTEILLSQGIDVTFAITNIPDDLARQLRIDRNDPLPLFTSEGDPWVPYLGRLFTTFGERIRRWQLGPTGASSMYHREGWKQDVALVREKLRRRVPRPLITVPWNLEHRAEEPLGADVLSTKWPLGIPAHEISAAMLDTNLSDNTVLLIETPDDATFGHRAAAIELSKRTVSAWAARAGHLAIRGPWTWTPESNDRLMPTIEAAVWRTLCRMLAESMPRGELPVADGATVLITETPSGGMLIGWNDSADEEAAMLHGWLGPGPIVVTDPFGNRTTIERDAEGSVTIQLGEMPLFITGIDANLALFRSRLRLEPAFLPARAEKHHLEIVMQNPWPVGITGRLRLAEPLEWSIAPRVIPFTLAPGASLRIPIELAFTIGEEAGRQSLIAEAELTAERHYPVQRLPMYLDIGLPSIELLPSYRLEPRPDGKGSDLIVSLLITNLAETPLTVEAFAQAPGYRAFGAPVSELEPGGSVMRRFRFEHGGTRLKSRSVRVGLKEADGTGRLNRTMVIE